MQSPDDKILGADRPCSVSVEALTLDYGEGRGVFNATLRAVSGEVVTLIGANGSGKSTLLRCVLGLEQADSGSCVIRVDNDTAARRGPNMGQPPRVRGLLQGSTPWPHLTVGENVELPLRTSLKLSPESARQRAQEALRMFDVIDRVDVFPSDLSGGLAQRVALARTLALRPSVLVLDEATSALDPEWTERVRTVIRAYADGGAVIILATHRMGFARRIADKVLFIHDGKIRESGRVDYIFEESSDSKLKTFLANA